MIDLLDNLYMNTLNQGFIEGFLEKLNKDFRLNNFFNKPERLEKVFKIHREMINLDTGMEEITASIESWLNFFEKHYPEATIDKIPLKYFLYGSTVRDLINLILEVQNDVK